MPQIMIVEDDMIAVMELEELLRTRNYEVVGIAESGPVAVAWPSM